MLYDKPMKEAPVATPPRIGVLLVNLGTPDSPSYFAVQRFLREFLSDRRVIETSRLIWLPLLYGLVLPFRPIKTVRKYRKVWMAGGSPLAVYSERLAAKVGRLMQDRFGDHVRVELGMTYGKPSLAHAIGSLINQDVPASCWCCLCTRNIVHRRPDPCSTAPARLYHDGGGSRRCAL